MIINEIMNKFWSNEIGLDQIKKNYAGNVKKSDLTDTLLIAYENKDKIVLGNGLFIGFALNLFSNENELILSKLLLQNWHREHEDIVGLFQKTFNDNVNNITPLLSIIETIPDYLNERDLKYPYLRKIIYAIGAQPEPNNIRALEGLLTNDDLKIVDLVKHQIEKRKSRGRWEAKSI